MIANTHAMYRTISHDHLDTFVNWVLGEFPDAGLMLVECQDGRWFVEVDHGIRFDGMPGVSCPNATPYVEPTFFGDESAATAFALECIKQAHPELANRDLRKCYDDYCGED